MSVAWRWRWHGTPLGCPRMCETGHNTPCFSCVVPCVGVGVWFGTRPMFSKSARELGIGIWEHDVCVPLSMPLHKVFSKLLSSHLPAVPVVREDGSFSPSRLEPLHWRGLCAHRSLPACVVLVCVCVVLCCVVLCCVVLCCVVGRIGVNPSQPPATTSRESCGCVPQGRHQLPCV